MTKQQAGNRVAEKKSVDIVIQTKTITSEDLNVLQKIVGQIREAVQAIYNTLENLKVINSRQEEVILRLERRLDKYEEKERKEEQDREERRRREERDRED